MVRARAAGVSVLVLTNAPRPAAQVMKQMDKIGIDGAAYDGVLSSGELVRARLASLDGPLFLLGEPRDAPLVEGYARTEDPSRAQALVAAGLMDGMSHDVHGHDPPLQQGIDAKVPLLCANADRWVPNGDQLMACAEISPIPLTLLAACPISR